MSDQPHLPPDLPPQLDSQQQCPPHSQASSDPESGQSGPTGESVSSDSPAEHSKVCYTCAKFLPASHFRFRSRATGVRMTECNTCFATRERDRNRKKRAREKGWAIQKTASQIARSPDLSRTVALLENLVDVMGGPEKLVETWHTECWKLTTQKRSSTWLVRMYEMLIVLMGQTHKAKHQHAAASPPKAAG